MNTPTPYLECVVLAAAAYPSGLGYSLFVTRKGPPKEVSTGFLVALALPYLAVTWAVVALRPGLLVFRAPTVALLVAAAGLAPVALLSEYGIHAVAAWRRSGSLPRRIGLLPFWRRELSLADHVLLALVAVGEEIFYRMLWLGTLLSLGLPASLALLVSSLAYGANHLAFGGAAIVSKTLTGAIYGCLYLLGGQSVWLPILTHGIQNIGLLTLAKPRPA